MKSNFTDEWNHEKKNHTGSNADSIKMQSKEIFRNTVFLFKDFMVTSLPSTDFPSCNVHLLDKVWQDSEANETKSYPRLACRVLDCWCRVCCILYISRTPGQPEDESNTKVYLPPWLYGTPQSDVSSFAGVAPRTLVEACLGQARGGDGGFGRCWFIISPPIHPMLAEPQWYLVCALWLVTPGSGAAATTAYIESFQHITRIGLGCTCNKNYSFVFLKNWKCFPRVFPGHQLPGPRTSSSSMTSEELKQLTSRGPQHLCLQMLVWDCYLLITS